MKQHRKVLIVALLLLAAIALVAQAKLRYTMDPDTCIGCQICEKACPVQAISMEEGKAVIDNEKCISCGICANKCPVSAIEGKAEEAAPPAEPEQAVEAEKSQLPKPYAVDVDQCIGCQLCVGKCPVGCIEMQHGKAVIDSDKCIGCGICSQTCPVKAIEQTE